MNTEIPTPMTDVAASDGWSGDAIAVPVEFAQNLERNLRIFQEALLKITTTCGNSNPMGGDLAVHIAAAALKWKPNA